MNTAQAEAVTVAVMESLANNHQFADLAARFDQLIADDEFLLHTGRATADKDAVDTRLTKARAAFS